MVMWWWALAYGDGGVSFLRWWLVVLFAVEVLDLDVCLLSCNSFLGGGFVISQFQNYLINLLMT
jgi:hypothetical protein